MAAAALIVAACAPAPSPSPPSPPQGTPGASATASASETATTTGGSTAGPAPTFDIGTIQLHLLADGVVAADAPVSAGGQVLWTAGTPFPSEIWRYVPGTAGPERVFASARPEATISSVVASAAGFAFVEESEPAYGAGGWRLWFLSAPGAQPVEIDRGVAKAAGFAPTVAMDDRRVAWAGFDEPPSGFVSRLGVVEVADLAHPAILLERPVRDSLLWFPCLNDDELWYATIHGDFDNAGVDAEYHLETIDLRTPAAAPIRFAGAGLDFNPAVNDGFVVWKTNKPGDAALNWGTINVLDRRTGELRAVPIDRGNRPSIGDRFVTFDEITHSHLVVFDPASGAVADLAEAARASFADPALLFGGESVSGRLLAFYAQGTAADALPRIGWAMLPG